MISRIPRTIIIVEERKTENEFLRIKVKRPLGILSSGILRISLKKSKAKPVAIKVPPVSHRTPTFIPRPKMEYKNRTRKKQMAKTD